MVRGGAGLLMVLLAAGGAAQVSSPAPDAGGPVTTIRTTARLVVLDVVVTDGHGHSVEGLKPSDFALTEDGVPQSLSSVTEHDAEVEPVPWQEREELPPNTFAVHPPEKGSGAVTVIVLGQLAFQDAPFVRDQLKAYLKTSAPETPIAIFSMDAMGMRLVQDFTSDPNVLREAADSKRILPPLGLPTMASYVRHGTLELSQYLNSIPGRINVIWFSSGGGGAPSVGGIRPEDAYSDLSTFARDLKGTTSVLRLSRVAVYAVDASGLSAQPVATPSPELFAMADVPNARLAETAESTGGKAFYNTNGFKEAIAEVVRTGAHYYTVSYTPTNHEWNGAFRRISLRVDTGKVSQLQGFLDWMNAAVKVQYRRGYFATDRPPSGRPAVAGYGGGQTQPDQAQKAPDQPQRKLISVSPRGNPGIGRGEQDDPLRKAMAFATPTPIELPYRITVTPAAEKDRTKAGQSLPKDNFLSQDWKTTPYRNCKVDYLIDASELHLQADAVGKHRGTFRFVIVVYRDNGEPVNSIATTITVNVSGAGYDKLLQEGLRFEQTVAVPTKINTNMVPVTANFFLRTGVQEVETGRIGAVEVPVEWVKLPAAETAEAK